MTTDSMAALEQLSAQLGGSEEASLAPAARPQTNRTIFTGRRKRSIARVRLVPGTGKFNINGRELEDYFPTEILQMTVNEPFATLDQIGVWDVIARITVVVSAVRLVRSVLVSRAPWKLRTKNGVRR